MRQWLMVILVVAAGLCHGGQAGDDPVRVAALNKWSAMKFGLFIHWGIYSIPAGVWEGEQIEKLGEQIQRHARIPHDEYAALAGRFNPVNFDADAIVSLARAAGMRYIVLTAKHHDGFCMFSSEHTEFDIVDATPYGRDILKQLADACRKHGLKLGVYYSTPDWHFNGPSPEVNPKDGKISVFSKVSVANEDYQVAQLKEILTNYGDIVELFFDMGEPTPAQSKRFADTVRLLQPSCMINGRVMNNEGDFITMPDNRLPDVPLTELPWETPGTFYHTWGYKSWVKGAPIEVQVRQQVRKLITIAARGGNFLLNIGPRADGSIVPYEVEVLRGIAGWTDSNGESIFGAGVSPFTGLEWGECTTGNGRLYLHVFDWPDTEFIHVPGLLNRVTRVYPLAVPSQTLDCNDGRISLEGVRQDPNATVIVLEYEDALRVEPARTGADSDGVLTLKGDEAIRHGRYGRESYRSILPDYHRSWHVGTLKPGAYEVSLTYRLRADEKDFVLEVPGDSLPFELHGRSRDEDDVTMDGNEEPTDSSPESNDGWKRASVGSVTLTNSAPFELILRQGRDFQLFSESSKFDRQDQRYRAMKLDIRALVLSPKRKMTAHVNPEWQP